MLVKISTIELTKEFHFVNPLWSSLKKQQHILKEVACKQKKSLKSISFLNSLVEDVLKPSEKKHPCNIIEELQNTRMNIAVKGSITFADSVGN